MRLAIIQNLYSNYIENFQSVNADRLTSYKDCLSVLHDESFAWNGVWGKELRKYDIEVFELYVNYDKLNYHWCSENGIDFGKHSIAEVLIEQLKAFKIEVLINTDVKILKSPFIKNVKSLPGLKGVFAHVCSPYFSYFDLTEYNAIFACVHQYVELFKSYGIPSFYVAHCFNPDILKKIEEPVHSENKIKSVFFAGGIIKGQDLHDDREKLILEFIERKISLDFFSELYFYNIVKSRGMVFAKRSIYQLIILLKSLGVTETNISRLPIIREGLSWKYLPGDVVNKDILKSVKKPLYGLQLFSQMQNYLVSLNIHAGAAQDEAANMRLFEATGVGSALLTDYKLNLSNFFNIDEEVVAYKSIPEALEKASFLLNNPKVAIAIGIAGQNRVLRDHTFSNRAPIIAKHIFELI